MDGWMLGAWRVAGIWSLGALQLVSAKKTSPCPHAILPAQACKLHWVTTNRRYLTPQTKSTNKTFFLYVSPLFSSNKTSNLRVFVLVNTSPLWRFRSHENPKKKHHCAGKATGSGSNNCGPPDVVPLGTWTFVHLHHHHQSRRSVTSKGHGPSLTRWRWEFFGVWKTFPSGIFSVQANKKAFFGIESWHKS